MEKFVLVEKFNGYNHKEDQTNLAPGLMVEGSRNVLTNDGERVMVRRGYTLDGQANSANTPITAAYDWNDRHTGEARHVRAYQDELEYRYVDSAGAVTWRRLANGFGENVNFNFAEFWDTTELIDRLLMVNGTSNIYDWSGGVTTLESVTASTIKKEGVETWGEEGFYTSGTRSVVLNGVTYAYTSGEGTDTIYGVTPDPTLSVFDQSQTVQDALSPFGEADATTKHNALAQSFIAGSAPIVGVQLFKSADTGSLLGSITVEIFADLAGSPTGSALASATVFNGTWLLKPTGLFGVTFTTPATLSVGLTYWIKVSASTADNANHPNIGTNAAGGYASGSVKAYNVTDGWFAVATIDFFFKTVTSATAQAAGQIIHQALRTTANSAITALPDTFANDLISVLYNYIYVGSFVDRSVYLSKQNSLIDFSFSSPRQPGQGAIITLDATPVGMIPEEEFMYISAGKSFWFRISLQLGADQTSEALIIDRLKTTGQQAAKSQAFITKNKNSVIYVSNEPTITSLGRVELIETPQTTDISDPIKDDMDVFSFDGGSSAYFKNNLYVAVPDEGLVLIFNGAKGWWEAPQNLPVNFFSIIEGALYGHSASVPETYKLFDGVNDNGVAIDAKAYFSYMQFGDRANFKNMTQWYTEGYISSNTSLTCRILYEYKGSKSVSAYEIDGSDNTIIFDKTGGGSFGKQSLGKRSLAGRGSTVSTLLPPKFRVINSFPKEDFYEMQIQYESVGEDQHWELLAWGPNVQASTATAKKIKQ